MKKYLIIILMQLLVLSACGQSGSTSNVIHLNEAQFKAKVFDYDKSETWSYKGDKPAIIDFYADWCRPCRELAPTIEELANEYEGEIYVYKVDVQKEQALASAFGIQSIPTILFVPQEGKPQVSQGALPKSQLKNIIKDVLKVE